MNEKQPQFIIENCSFIGCTWDFGFGPQPWPDTYVTHLCDLCPSCGHGPIVSNTKPDDWLGTGPDRAEEIAELNKMFSR